MGVMKRYFSRFNFKEIITSRQQIEQNAMKRNSPVNLQDFELKYNQLIILRQEQIKLNQERSLLASQVEQILKDKKNGCSVDLMEQAKEVKFKVKKTETEIENLETLLNDKAYAIPNDTSPQAQDSDQIIQEFPGRQPNIPSPKDHIQLGNEYDLLDFDTRIAGSRFYCLKNQAALLEMNLTQFAIKKCLDRGFKLVFTPDLHYSKYLAKCGYQPRSDRDQLLSISQKPDLCLSATSEITLAARYSDQILENSEPIKLIGFSHCFRSETGHYGKESRGLYRVHQFPKVEMFGICPKELSEILLEEIKEIEIEIYRELDLPIRVLLMGIKELGHGAYKKFDIECKFVSRDYGEISSCSNMTDYQSKRLNLRFRRFGKLESAHTVNGTALAVPRVLMAILENYQLKDSIEIPKALRFGLLENVTHITKAPAPE